MCFAVVFQSGGFLPLFATAVVKQYKTMLWRAELHLNMSTSTKELVWVVHIAFVP